MRVTVVRPGELGRTEAGQWARFQQASPLARNPFLSLTFAQAVGRARPGARVAVVEDGGETVAFLPFEQGPRGVAMPVGYPMNDLQGFVGSGAPVDARAVIRKAGLRGWRFIAAPVQQAALAPYHYAGTAIQVPVIDLAGGYQAYAKSRSRSLNAETARKRRALARTHGPVSLDRSAGTRHLGQLIDWRAGKYSSAQQLFADPTTLPILEELASEGGDDCRGVTYVLSAGEKPVAINFWLSGPEGLTAWFPGYDLALSRFSPGTMMVFSIAEEAAGRGLTRIDLGYGQNPYKFVLGNDAYQVAGGAVWASRAEELGRRAYRVFRERTSAPRPPALTLERPAAQASAGAEQAGLVPDSHR